MKKLMSKLVVFGILSFFSFATAQESIPETGGYTQISLPCPNNMEIVVERCYWVLWDSSCDPSVQELC